MQRRKVPQNVVALTALLKAVGSTPGPAMARECTRIFRRMMHGPARCGRVWATEDSSRPDALSRAGHGSR